ncbi:MAG: hypothetical protein ACK52I_35205 [Pseudomonadota bacterium]
MTGRARRNAPWRPAGSRSLAKLDGEQRSTRRGAAVPAFVAR